MLALMEGEVGQECVNGELNVQWAESFEWFKQKDEQTGTSVLCIYAGMGRLDVGKDFARRIRRNRGKKDTSPRNVGGWHVVPKRGKGTRWMNEPGQSEKTFGAINSGSGNGAIYFGRPTSTAPSRRKGWAERGVN